MTSYIEKQLGGTPNKPLKPLTASELIDAGVDVTRPRRRGIMVRLAKLEKPRKREKWSDICICSHTRKKHKQSGRCRGNCSCTAGASRVAG